MQRTVRALRLILPLLFLGFVALIVVSYTANSRRDHPAGAPITSTIRAGDRPKFVTDVFEDTQTLGGRIISRIRARRTVGFSSGWTTLEGVTLTLYRSDGGEYNLTCTEAQFNSKTKEAVVKGGVKLTSSDGMELQTEQLKYDGSKLVNDIPVAFAVDTWRGKAGGLSLDVESQTLLLRGGVSAATSSGEAVQNSITITSAETLIRRKEASAEFRKQVVLKRELDTLQSDTVFLRFDQSHRILVSLEGRDHVTMSLAGNSTLASPRGASSGGKLEADWFFCDLSPEGAITAVHMVGEGSHVARARIEGVPVREIEAKHFVARMAERVVTELEASQNVHMVELGATRRKIDGQKVRIFLDKSTRAAVSGVIEGGFRYDDGKNRASSDRADYDIPGDRVVMTEVPGSAPSLRSEGYSLKANRIELAPKEGTLRATGNIISQLDQGRPATSRSTAASPSASGTSLFPADRPVFINADTLVIRQAVQTASFSGNVKAWQENNTLFASELQVEGAGDQIAARGGVKALLYNAAADARKTPLIARSDQISGRKSARRLDLLGNVRIEDGSRVLTSEKAAFFFDSSRKIDRVEAESNVVMTETQTKRKGSGSKAVYQIGKKMLVLTGSPAEMTDPKGTVKGAQILFDLAKNKVDIASSGMPNEASYRP